MNTTHESELDTPSHRPSPDLSLRKPWHEQVQIYCLADDVSAHIIICFVRNCMTAIVQHKRGKLIRNSPVLIDSSSQSYFITEKMAKQLNFPRERVDLPIYEVHNNNYFKGKHP
uniref:Uncharacterized protein n=1 Tax=Vespula pensylvanica TaxID=30213 RepID=A0A834K548_VESPE|nr:hypothetical protein H0235_015980 [Vespula pensylvanica]